MEKDNVSNKENENKTKKVARKIKQVELSDDGLNKTVVAETQIKSEDEITEEAIERETKREIEEDVTQYEIEIDEDDTKIYDPSIHGHHDIIVHESEIENGNGRRVRICAIVAALVFSLLFAAVVGMGLALWDEGKSFAELKMAIVGQNVSAKTLDEYEEGTVKEEDDSKLDKAINQDAVEDATYDEADMAEDIKSQEKESISDAKDSVEDDDILSSEIAGVGSIVRAGTDDVLETSVKGSQVTAYVDPNANYPLSFTTVDESYFTDALFIGDSRLQGFGMWSGLPATYYCATGFQLYKYETTNVVQTANGKVPIFDALPYDAFTKIYIKVGLNEIGWATEEKFEEKYAELIAKLREYEPRAIIYVHGVLPVTAEKSATDSTHTNPNVSSRNASLAEFAIKQKAYFINAGLALQGPDGALPAEMTNDGIHLKSQYMTIWKQYLMEHAIVVK